MLEKGKATIVANESSSEFKVIPLGDSLVAGKVAHVEGDRLVTGIVEGVVDGEMKELAAFDCLKMSREATKNFHEKGGVEKFIKQVNNHSFCSQSRRDLKVPGFRHRDWWAVVVWK